MTFAELTWEDLNEGAGSRVVGRGKDIEAQTGKPVISGGNFMRLRAGKRGETSP